jgi:hypothetical protein
MKNINLHTPKTDRDQVDRIQLLTTPSTLAQSTRYTTNTSPGGTEGRV